MTTTLGILYWGRDAHLDEIERAIPRFIENGRQSFSDVWQAVRTPSGARKLSEQTGITWEILRILKHDIELWLPTAVLLAQMEWFQHHPACLKALADIGVDQQLVVISAGQTPAQREQLALQTRLDLKTTEEIVKQCDYYRTGKNLTHLRAKMYYEMGLDTWQKWAAQTSEAVIALFTAYLQANHLEGERLIPWPKEVRNGIEWARVHVGIYAVEW
jgi:hypothetical protein